MNLPSFLILMFLVDTGHGFPIRLHNKGRPFTGVRDPNTHHPYNYTGIRKTVCFDYVDYPDSIKINEEKNDDSKSHYIAKPSPSPTGRESSFLNNNQRQTSNENGYPKQDNKNTEESDEVIIYTSELFPISSTTALVPEDTLDGLTIHNIEKNRYTIPVENFKNEEITESFNGNTVTEEITTTGKIEDSNNQNTINSAEKETFVTTIDTFRMFTPISYKTSYNIGQFSVVDNKDQEKFNQVNVNENSIANSSDRYRGYSVEFTTPLPHSKSYFNPYGGNYEQTLPTEKYNEIIPNTFRDENVSEQTTGKPNSSKTIPNSFRDYTLPNNQFITKSETDITISYTETNYVRSYTVSNKTLDEEPTEKYSENTPDNSRYTSEFTFVDSEYSTEPTTFIPNISDRVRDFDFGTSTDEVQLETTPNYKKLDEISSEKEHSSTTYKIYTTENYVSIDHTQNNKFMTPDINTKIDPISDSVRGYTIDSSTEAFKFPENKIISETTTVFDNGFSKTNFDSESSLFTLKPSTSIATKIPWKIITDENYNKLTTESLPTSQKPSTNAGRRFHSFTMTLPKKRTTYFIMNLKPKRNRYGFSHRF